MLMIITLPFRFSFPLRVAPTIHDRMGHSLRTDTQLPGRAWRMAG